MMEWSSVGMMFHSQYDGKVIIQSCSKPPTSYQNSRISHFSIFSLGMAIPCTKSHHSAMDLPRFLALNVQVCPLKITIFGEICPRFPTKYLRIDHNVGLMLKPYYYTHQC